MISQCPHCSQALKFSQPQMEKFRQALARLAGGKALKFGCPKCKTPIEVDREGNLAEKGPAPDRAQGPVVDPPAAPDIAWLSSGTEEGGQILEDVPTAMVLIKAGEVLEQVIAVLKAENLQIHIPETVDEAVSGMRFKEYDVVVYNTDFEDGPLDVHDFHKFISNMSMNRRRKILYILVGEEVKTLYDLEALTLSANITVNTRELPYFDKIFSKGKKGYDTLFGPYISMLRQHGKS